MAFNIIEASKLITEKYTRYLKTTFDIADPEYRALFLDELENGEPFSKGPYLDVIDSFKKGMSVPALINEGVLNKDFKFIENIFAKTLHLHQEIAVRKTAENRNLVVSTGTGSGKTECFLIPILNSLMEEKEKSGGITPGVRALIIYPMNALANDQIDRLRGLLSNYKDITFGCYTGQTEYTEEKAKLQFAKLNPGKTPLRNERISREAMKNAPPHILITNYAMLEYLMLRPADNVFFDGKFAKNWKYIVLDEAHTYTGSTGIEVSMLLRRVVAKLHNPKLQYILTSATLGDENSNNEVVNFAENLCNATFYEQDIIRAQRIDLTQSSKGITNRFDKNFYNYIFALIEKGYGDNYILEKINDRYGLKNTNTGLAEFLYELLLSDETYWRVKSFLRTSQSVSAVCNYMNWSSQDLAAFVEVASHASKNGMKLFDSRYHMFIRATEGVFVTLPPVKKLFLERRNTYFENGKEYKVFEVVSCSQCHSLYILGQIENNHLVQKSNLDPQEIKEAFWIGTEISDNDEDNSLEAEDLTTDKFELCPYCGFIRKANEVHKKTCGHSQNEYIKITKVKTSKITGRVTKCVACESVNRLGILRGFFSGQEASTSVIGTALFEELPAYDKKIILHTQSEDGFDDGFEEDEEEQAVHTPRAKQFIAFSDSRQAAAYFSSYFSETYDGILYGRIIRDLILSMNEESKPIPNFVKELSSMFSKNKIAPFQDSAPDYVTESWKAVLKELVDNRARNSLIGLGLMNIEPIDTVQFRANSKFHLSEEEVKNICMVFVMSMLSDAAIYYNKEIDEDNKEFFTHNGVEATYLLNVSNAYGVRSFVPKIEGRTNKRLEYLLRVFKAKGIDVAREDAVKFMEALWGRFFDKQGEGLLKNVSIKNGATGYRVNSEKIAITKNARWYRCPRCNRLTTYNVSGVCPSYRCDGTLEAVDVNELEKNNHYFRMYGELPIQALRVVEHTAQLNREEAYKYQNLFKDKQIDVLSCSTTFEMGVDVGELETVFMRNMPPSPSNYAQRAGRAGRSSQSAAFALTFCNKSNHDFNFFRDPISMINGAIRPPMFKTDNEKICIRHVYSAALAFFWRLNSECFSTAETMMEDSGDKSSGYVRFKEYLQSKPEDLKEYLFSVLPQSMIELFGVKNFGWVEWLFDTPQDNYPNLKRVYELYNEEVSTLLKDKQKIFDNGGNVDYITRQIGNYRREKIINFLSKNGILPKYGFPVDTVELSVSNKNISVAGLDLSRDLSIAISEYAPGCQVVANGKLITSRFIRKVPNEHWKMYDFVKCPECQTLNIDIHTESGVNESLTKCKQCGKDFTVGSKKTFLIPDFGFIAESKIEKPTLVKPERTYRTEASFVNYNTDIPETQFDINGTKVFLATVDNGPMAILTTDDFFVCEACGYALDPTMKTGVFTKETLVEHKSPTGKACANKRLHKFSLGYRFETDVVRLRIEKALYFEQAYSVLQAIILSACKQLNIDNNEIAGCLQYYKEGFYNFVLYDTTPGGAGHVKRLNNQDILTQVLRLAYDRTETCGCGGDNGDSSCYSCLRTYQNQRYHDMLKRSHVVEYLKDIVLE